MDTTSIKRCPTCGETVKGRRDKVYCSLKCKSTAHYDKRIENEQYYLMVNKQLKVNRKLLKLYNKAGKATVRKNVLMQDGFNPKYFTHYWKNPKGEVYLFCYEFGFLELMEHDKIKYVLVQWQEYMEHK